MKKFNEIVILIPSYKPSNELIMLVNSLIEKDFLKIIIIDDGSGKEYLKIFENLPKDIVLLRHLENKGKGNALKTGLKYIYENYKNCIGIVTCDSDGQHTTNDICLVAKSLVEKGHQSLILGSRRFQGNVPMRSALGNKITRNVFHVASGVKLLDTQTGLRAFNYNMIPLMIKISGERYEYEMNVLLEIAKQKIDIIEIQIQTVYKDGNKSSHFNTVRDSAIIYANIIKFSLSSLTCFGVDFIMLFVFQYITQSLPYETSLLISVICARILSSLVNYTINRHAVFRENKNNAFYKYYILVVVMISINFVLLSTLSSSLGITLFWSKIITEIILFLLSYNVQKKWVFSKEHLV